MVQAFGFLGSEGWELVALYDKTSNWLSGMEKGFAIFKKEVGAGDLEPEQWASWDHADFVGRPSEERRRFGPQRLADACKAGKHDRCHSTVCLCACHSSGRSGSQLS